MLAENYQEFVMLQQSNCHVFSGICHDCSMEWRIASLRNGENCHAQELQCWLKIIAMLYQWNKVKFPCSKNRNRHPKCIRSYCHPERIV